MQWTDERVMRLAFNVGLMLADRARSDLAKFGIDPEKTAVCGCVLRPTDSGDEDEDEDEDDEDAPSGLMIEVHVAVMGPNPMGVATTVMKLSTKDTSYEAGLEALAAKVAAWQDSRKLEG